MDTPVQSAPGAANPPKDDTSGKGFLTEALNGASAPGSTPAPAGDGAAFIQETMGAQLAALSGQQPAEVPAPVAPVAQIPDAPPVQAPAAPPPAVPVAPPPAVPVALPPAAPVAPPPAVPTDYALRFSNPGGVPVADPMAGIVEVPPPPPDAQVNPPEHMSDAQNHAWAALRAQANHNRRLVEQGVQKYNELVRQMRKLQNEKAEFATRISGKDKEIDDLRNEIGRIDLSRSPEFKEKYDAPILKIHDDIARTLVDNGVEQAEAGKLAEQILKTPDEQIPELVASLPSYVQGMVMIKAQEAGQAFDARQHALDDWRTSQEGLAAVASRGSAMIDAQRRGKLADDAIRAAKAMVGDQQIPAYQVVDPAFVADREQHEQQFRAWFGQAPIEQQVAAMFEGFMAPKTYEMLNTIAAENAQLKTLLYSHGRAANPPVRVLAEAASAPAPAPMPAKTEPTLKKDGFSLADAGDVQTGEAFVRGLFGGGPGAGA